MRVISGTAKGRKLETLAGNDIVRPTADIVKEAVFSSIQFLTEGRKFLDLFAGSGQMGIEALSRGASQCVFVDSNKNSIKIIKKNLETVKFTDNARVYQTDSLCFADTCNEKFDLVFLDPPFKSDLIEKALPKVTKITNKTGRIICEACFDKDFPEEVNDFVIYKKYRYGKIAVCVYIHNSMKE